MAAEDMAALEQRGYLEDKFVNNLSKRRNPCNLGNG